MMAMSSMDVDLVVDLLEDRKFSLFVLYMNISFRFYDVSLIKLLHR
jgi:hypothetical protein